MDTARAGKYAAVGVAAVIAGAAGLVGSSLVSDSGESSNPRVTIFCANYPVLESSDPYKRWARSNPGERDKWLSYRSTICLDQLPQFPVMATSFGKWLVEVGRMALTIDVPPPTTSTTSTTTTTSVPTTTTTTTAPTTTTTTTQPPPTGNAIDDFGDLTAAFVPGYVSPVVSGGTGGGGIWQVPTPRGPGFKMIVTDQMPATWNAGLKDVLAQKRNVAAVGSTEDWRFSFMLPAVGNPNGVPDRWQGGLLWEFHTQSDSGHHLAIDGRQSDGGPRLHFGRYMAPWTPGSSYQHYYDPAKLRYDHWYDCRLQIKWSSGSDGFLKFWLDGALLVDFSGSTIKSGEQGYLQFGDYAVRELTNEVWFGGISRS